VSPAANYRSTDFLHVSITIREKNGARTPSLNYLERLTREERREGRHAEQFWKNSCTGGADLVFENKTSNELEKERGREGGRREREWRGRERGESPEGRGEL